ncbi:MAG: c-type cytochrome [candidate division NC10 bacterium]|nr:c-type cytochrome [candidate division NC10 bacterium]
MGERVGLIVFVMVLSFSVLTFSSWAEEDKKGDLVVGEAVYKEICFSCHGLKGDGKGPSWLNTKPRPQVFANPNYTSRLIDQYLFEVAKYGKLAVLKRQTPLGEKAVAMPSFGDVLDDDQIRALIRFERGFSNGGAQDEGIREIFNDACAPCHGPSGRGDGPRASEVQPAPREFVSLIQPAPGNLTDLVFMARFSDDFLFNLIKKGRIKATEEAGFDTMQPYGHILSDDELWSVVQYIWETFIDHKE